MHGMQQRYMVTPIPQLTNMVTLYFFGPELGRYIGARGVGDALSYTRPVQVFTLLRPYSWWRCTPLLWWWAAS